MSFSMGVAKWVVNSKEEIRRNSRVIVFRLFADVIKDTPVLEGRLRGNWFPALGDPSGEVDNNFQGAEAAATAASIDRVSQVIANFSNEKDFKVFLTNNLPYANSIEYDGQSRVKAPAGMVRKNLARITEIIEQSRRRL